MIIYPLAKQTINSEILDKLCEWLKTNPRLTKDKLTLEFEEKVAKWVGKKYCVFVNSGSSANLLAINAALILGKQKNKKIVVPSVAWATTITPAIQLGMTPIMIGPDSKTFGIDLDKLENICIKENPGSVIFVQVLGVPHHKERLLSLRDKYGFILIEDACPAQGSQYADGTKVGNVGDMSTFSWYFGHTTSTVEGGTIHTDSKEIYDLLLMLRSHGWLKDLDEESRKKYIEKYEIDDFHQPFTFVEVGYNVRSTDLQAFIGLEQMKLIDAYAEQRNMNHRLYKQKLQGLGFMFQEYNEKEIISSISFGCLAKSKEERTRIVKALDENGIETRLFSAGSLDQHPFWYERYEKINDPLSLDIHQKGFFLPNNFDMKEKDVEFICEVVRKSVI